MKRMAVLVCLCLIYRQTAGQSLLSSDSTSLWSRLSYLEFRTSADFPKTFAEVQEVLNNARASDCQSCKGRGLLVMGKFYWANGQYEDGLRCFRQSISIAEPLNDFETLSKATDLIANTYYYQAYYDSAAYYFQKAYEIAEMANNLEGMIMILHNTSLMYHRKGDFKRTVEYIFKGEALKDKLPQSQHHIEAMGAMGSLMIDSIYYQEEINDELKNLHYYESKGDLKSLYRTYHNIGKAYRQLEDYRTAAWYFIKAAITMKKIDLIPEWDLVATDYRDANMKDSSFYYHYLAKRDLPRNTRPNAAYTLELLGDAHLYYKQPDSALYYYGVALAMNYKMNNRITFTGIHRNLVRAHGMLGNYKEAEYHLETGLKLAKEIALIHEKNLYREAKFLYELKGDYKKALYYSEKFKDYLDSINRQETAINLTRMQAEFKTAKKEDELEDMRQLNLLSEERIKTKNLQMGLAALSIVLLSSFGGIYYLRFKQKKKDSELLESQNKEKEVLLHEIHHRVKNNLQIISSLINLKARSADQSTNEILKELNGRIYSLGLIHEMLYKTDKLGFIDLKEYLTEQCKLTIASLLPDQSVELCMDLEPIEVSIDSALAIGLISNELITNSIKYAFKPDQPAKKIFISFRRESGQNHFKIADNGDSIHQSNVDITRSFGLRFVEQLVKTKLNGELSISRINGLVIDMNFKLPLAS